jgi:hypothetical protein
VVKLWAVVLTRQPGLPTVWAPFDDKDQADAFAVWVSVHIDPATTIPLRDPVAEMLSEYESRIPEQRNLWPAR